MKEKAFLKSFHLVIMCIIMNLIKKNKKNYVIQGIDCRKLQIFLIFNKLTPYVLNQITEPQKTQTCDPSNCLICRKGHYTEGVATWGECCHVEKIFLSCLSNVSSDFSRNLWLKVVVDKESLHRFYLILAIQLIFKLFLVDQYELTSNIFNLSVNSFWNATSSNDFWSNLTRVMRNFLVAKI